MDSESKVDIKEKTGTRPAEAIPDSFPDNEPIIDALLAEYQSVHARVTRQISQYDDTNVKMLMLVGVLLWFGISQFSKTDNPYIPQFVDMIFFVALPIIAVSSIILSIADLVKVMILGDYLKIIEDKINRVLMDQASVYEFPRNRVMDWEYWRLKYGHVKGPGALSEISFSFIIVSLIVLTAFFSAIVRLRFLKDNELFQGEYRTSLVLLIVFLVAFFAILGISVWIFASRRKKTKQNVNTELLKYE